MSARWYGLDAVAQTDDWNGQRVRAPSRAGARGGERAPRRRSDQEGAIMRTFKGRNPFRLLFGSSSRREDFLTRYVVREHARGRNLAEIFDDPFVRNRSTPEERRRLLDRPEVVAALGENALEDLRRAVRSAV